MTFWHRAAAVGTAVAMVTIATVAASQPGGNGGWNAQRAADYLDSRLNWWLHWPNAARDHDTSCVSCHTVAPYALARPALRRALGERELAAPERTMIAGVVKRVRSWKDVEPFYPDQTRGLPKTSESRGTEAVLNSLVLAARDAGSGELSDDTRRAMAEMWALQFKAGDLKGAWAWLNFHYEPWEADGGAYYGATLAALAVGIAPGNLPASSDFQDRLESLRAYLQRRVETETLFNRVMVLWAAAKVPNLLTAAQHDSIVDAAGAAGQDDGGWSLARLGNWKRMDATPFDGASDGYATGLVTLALGESGSPRAAVHVERGRRWLLTHQDAATGMWRTSSLNKARDPASDAGKFMSDAATAYAALALATPKNTEDTKGTKDAKGSTKQ